MRSIALTVLVALVAIPQAAGGYGRDPIAPARTVKKIERSVSQWRCPSARRALTFYRERKNAWLELRGMRVDPTTKQPLGCALVRTKVRLERTNASAARAAYRRWLKSYSYRGSNPNVRLGQRMAARYGWHRGPEWDALYALWNRESGWDHRAYNPSGACGIPQSMTSCFGFDPETQISWGLGYIRGRYGAPSSAYSHLRWRNWY